MKGSEFVEYPWIDFSAKGNMSDLLSLMSSASNLSSHLDPDEVFLLNVSHRLTTTSGANMGTNDTFSSLFYPGGLDEFSEDGVGPLMEGPSFNGTSNRKEIAQLMHVRYIVIVLYLLTFLFGLLGNSLTILVIIKNNKMKTVASCFILNLAVADDLFMLTLPFFAHSTFTRTWVFGSVVCSLMTAFYGINLYASIFTMVLMSIDRYLAIVHPLRSIRYRTIKNALIVCVCIWMACIVIMTPYWLYARTYYGKSGHPVCKVTWPVGSLVLHLKFWHNFELIIGFILPILIMVVCYMQLLRHIVKDDGPLQNQTKKPIKKVTAMVFLVTIVFIVCWTPYRILKYDNMQKTIGYRSMKPPTMPSDGDIIRAAIYNTIAQALVFVSSCCNPFIYGISSKNFREYSTTLIGENTLCTRSDCLALDRTANRGYLIWAVLWLNSSGFYFRLSDVACRRFFLGFGEKYNRF